jgi:Cft2 family RNA processing exonuclease
MLIYPSPYGCEWVHQTRKSLLMKNYRKFCELQNELARLKKSSLPKQKVPVTTEIEEIRSVNRALAEPPERATEQQLCDITRLQARVDELSK